MAFKMTPGSKGNPAQKRVQALGACGGDGQPPCEPLFEKEKQEKKAKKFIRAKVKKVEVPVKGSPKEDETITPPKVVGPVAGPVVTPVEGGKEGGKKPPKGKK